MVMQIIYVVAHKSDLCTNFVAGARVVACESLAFALCFCNKHNPVELVVYLNADSCRNLSRMSIYERHIKWRGEMV